MSNTDLYRHFDSNGNLLYVGISLSTLNRLGQHRDNSHWFNTISSVTIEKFDNRDMALIAEKEAIINEKPLYNTIHNVLKQYVIHYYEICGEYCIEEIMANSIQEARRLFKEEFSYKGIIDIELV